MGKSRNCGEHRPDCTRSCRSAAALHRLDRHLLKNHVLAGTIVSPARQFSNFLDDILALDYFAEDGVLAGEPTGWHDRDEELRTVRIWTSIGHRKFARPVEAVRRSLGLVFKLISRAPHASALWISALDHEIGNHAMEDRSVIESVLGFFSCGRMRPLTLALGEFDKVGDRLRCIFVKKTADDVSFGGFKRGVHSRLTSHRILSKMGSQKRMAAAARASHSHVAEVR